MKKLIEAPILTIATSASNVLLRELMLAAFIAMFPDPSTALGGRLLAFKNLMESEGSDHFETPDKILEELQQALNLAEMNNEGSKPENALKVLSPFHFEYIYMYWINISYLLIQGIRTNS